MGRRLADFWKLLEDALIALGECPSIAVHVGLPPSFDRESLWA